MDGQPLIIAKSWRQVQVWPLSYAAVHSFTATGGNAADVGTLMIEARVVIRVSTGAPFASYEIIFTWTWHRTIH